jgi:hypothetical protein
MKTPYPDYQVLDKWDSPSFDDKTRQVLSSRLRLVPRRRFFTEQEWRLLDAIAARVVPQPEREQPVPITPWIDAQLFHGRGEGFRHDNMPLVMHAWRAGLAAIDAEARARFARGSIVLDEAGGAALVRGGARDDVDPALWSAVPAQRFFIDILAKSVAGVYYAHPAAWSEIGFGGPASPRGYVRLGFDERDAWEGKEVP